MLYSIAALEATLFDVVVMNMNLNSTSSKISIKNYCELSQDAPSGI